jgi:RND family efflux transporter MFP subunit
MTPESETGPRVGLHHPDRFHLGGPWLLYVIGGLLVLIALLGVWRLHHKRFVSETKEAESRRQEVSKGPRVRVAAVTMPPVERTVTLPGEVRAFNQTTLYAKVSGYLKTISVDKGDRVKRDQLLATLESPDIDQAVVTARADLLLKRVSANRTRTLSHSGVMSKQDLDNANAALKESKSEVRRTRALQDYLQIRAPFAGVITARYVDPGALLPAAINATQSAQPVLDIADMDRVRIYIYLGQDDAVWVKEGDPAVVTLDARPAEPIPTTVTRLSRSLDPRTRTMLCEFDLPNVPLKLYPGEFVHAALKLRAQPTAVVPSEALLAKGDKYFVAEIESGHVHLVQVQPGNDNGKIVQINSGLKGGEHVALNAAGELDEGMPVQVIEGGPPQASASAPAQDGGEAK